MEDKKLKAKLKSNGIECIQTADSISFDPIRISQIKYILITLLFIPALYVFLFITGPSIVGLFTLAAGISCVYHGWKSRKEVLEFNDYNLKIRKGEIISGEIITPYSKFQKFKAGLSTNPLFPNIGIVLKSGEKEKEVLKIWNKSRKYLNDDKYDIISGLKEIVKNFNEN